jgi:RNA ligase (TIGR02306 family)
MQERKLATIRKIDAIDPIEGADTIEVATVDGWKVVVKKGEFPSDTYAIFCEIDSWIPHELAPFLTRVGKEPQVFEGIKGERLRTVKLRGQISQGLLLHIGFLDEWTVGDDVTEHLGIIKWERPISAQLAGMARGNFPLEVPKTYQERIQNLGRSRLFESIQEDNWSVTEKLDGASCTFYLDINADFHVCSRNLDLKEDETNTYWRLANKFKIEDIMRRNFMLGMAIQGEMIGLGIQGNQYKNNLDFYIYDIYNTKINQYLLPIQLKAACAKLGLSHVPIISENTTLQATTIAQLIEEAEGKSVLNGSSREGLVYKSNTVHDRSWKCVSNSWLLKNE